VTASRAALALTATLALTACARACDEPASKYDPVAPAPPPPPLVHDPEPAEGGREPASLAAKLRNLSLRRGLRDDTVELRPARPGDDPSDPKFRVGLQSSETVGVAAVSFFHASFAKAHPGFDLTRPRLLTPAQLLVLANDLAEMAMTVLAASDLAAAKARWPKVSLLSEIDRDDEWAATRPVLAETARALSAKTKAHADAKEGLWVLTN